jgi:hypothetical protein
MTTEKEIKQPALDSQHVNDIDLVELAGLHAYKMKRGLNFITVNGKKFEVMNVIKDFDTGLDAFTVQNTITKDYTVVYVGTDTESIQDIKTDLKLLRSTPPAQLTKGLSYFDEMEKMYGPISSISGNSLGGGIANYVAVERPEVKAVTLNPAPLPSGVVDPKATYDNMTNYMSQYDVLTRGMKAFGYGNRIPGNHFGINNGIPGFKTLDTNHTGYRKKGIDEQYYEIIPEGEPGAGKIYIDAGSHIMTSIWTGVPLYYDNSEPININVESLKQLANGIQDEIHTRVKRAHGYLKSSIEIVDHEGSQYTNRVNKLQDLFKIMIEGEVGNTVFKGITTPSSVINMEIDYMIAQTYVVERRCESLNFILNSPSAQLLEFITSTNVDVASIFESVRRQLRDFKDKVEDVSAGLDRLVRRELVKTFKGGTEMWLDAVVREMQAHFNIVDNNKGLLEKHIKQYQEQVDKTASAFKEKDESVADAIRNQRMPDASVNTGQATKDYKLQESPYLVLTLRMKEIQVNAGYGALQVAANTLVRPLLQLLKGILISVELLLESAVKTVRGALSIGFNWTVPGIVIGLFTDFDDRVRDMVSYSLQPIDELLELVNSLRIGVTRLDGRLPQVIHSLRPYIDSAIFDKSAFHNVHLYNTAAVSLFDDMDMLFEDIVSQLSTHKAKSITSLQELSRQVKDNMRLLKEQTARGTI